MQICFFYLKTSKNIFSNVYWKFSVDNKKALKIAPSVCLKTIRKFISCPCKTAKKQQNSGKIVSLLYKNRKTFFLTFFFLIKVKNQSFFKKKLFYITAQFITKQAEKLYNHSAKPKRTDRKLLKSF